MNTTQTAAEKKAAKAASAKETRAIKAELKRIAKEEAEAQAIAELELQDEDESGEEEGYRMSNQLRKYRARYQRSVAASGSKSLNNGDALAAYLEMKTGKEVCELADKFLPMDGQTHFERYARLNEGQKRMNAGNKLRAAVKNNLITVTEKGIKPIKQGRK
jgi:hypothetical protein